MIRLMQMSTTYQKLIIPRIRLEFATDCNVGDGLKQVQVDLTKE